VTQLVNDQRGRTAHTADGRRSRYVKADARREGGEEGGQDEDRRDPTTPYR